MSDENPFKEYQADFRAFERETRERRAELHRRRDDIAIDLLRTGMTVAEINKLIGTTSPTWIYDACKVRGLGTPGEVRAMSAPEQEFTMTPTETGYRVVANTTRESAVFTWMSEAGGYTPSEVNAARGSNLHGIVKRFGRGLLPFPFTPPKNPQA